MTLCIRYLKFNSICFYEFFFHWTNYRLAKYWVKTSNFRLLSVRTINFEIPSTILGQIMKRNSWRVNQNINLHVEMFLTGAVYIVHFELDVKS